MERRAFITGIDGFVGRVLRAYLEGRDWEVVGCDLAPPEGDGAVCACDVSDPDRVRESIAWAGAVTHVFHLAAITFVPETGRDPSRAFGVNLLGTVHLTNALRDHLPEARFLNVGSAAMYGAPQSLPITEAHPLNPDTPYSISKAAADQYCGYLSGSGALDVIRVRPFNHTGPGQPDQFVLSSFAHQVAQAEAGTRDPVLRVGNLTASRDFLHVNDVVRAYELLARSGDSGGVYNICSGRAVTIQVALDVLLSMARIDIEVRQDPARMRPVDIVESYGSHDKLTADTGWRPSIAFEQLLADLLAYWREREECSGAAQ
ncbi:MAG: NAD-dependent epimerase/dehydratase family protein [Nitrospiraceae bacterium]|nr:NAD-dependent epimerase/dehydratase family protein [Nitrospiraceae bacterium]